MPEEPIEKKRRVTDVMLEMENIRSQVRNNTILATVALITFAGSIIIYISVASAKDVMRPVSDKQIKLETRIDGLETTLCEIKDGQKEVLALLRKHYDK